MSGGSGSVEIVAHIGALGRHDMWIVAPMAILGFLLMVVLARPKAPPADESEAEAVDARRGEN